MPLLHHSAAAAYPVRTAELLAEARGAARTLHFRTAAGGYFNVWFFGPNAGLGRGGWWISNTASTPGEAALHGGRRASYRDDVLPAMRKYDVSLQPWPEAPAPVPAPKAPRAPKAPKLPTPAPDAFVQAVVRACEQGRAAARVDLQPGNVFRGAAPAASHHGYLPGTVPDVRQSFISAYLDECPVGVRLHRCPDDECRVGASYECPVCLSAPPSPPVCTGGCGLPVDQCVAPGRCDVDDAAPEATESGLAMVEAWREGWRAQARKDFAAGHPSQAEELRGKAAAIPYAEGWASMVTDADGLRQLLSRTASTLTNMGVPPNQVLLQLAVDLDVDEAMRQAMARALGEVD